MVRKSSEQFPTARRRMLPFSDLICCLGSFAAFQGLSCGTLWKACWGWSDPQTMTPWSFMCASHHPNSWLESMWKSSKGSYFWMETGCRSGQPAVALSTWQSPEIPSNLSCFVVLCIEVIFVQFSEPITFFVAKQQKWHICFGNFSFFQFRHF